MTTDQTGEGQALTKRQQALKDRRDEAAAIQAAQPLSWWRAVSDDALLLGPAVWVAGALLRKAPGQAQPWKYQSGREREHRWEFFISVPDIGRYARLKDRAVQQGLHDLQAHGYLHQLARGGKRGTVPIASTWLLILPEPGESPNPHEAQVGDGTGSEPTEPAAPDAGSDQQPAAPNAHPFAPPPADPPDQPATDTQPKTPDPAEGQQKPPGVSEGAWAAASAGEARGASHRTPTKHEAAA